MVKKLLVEKYRPNTFDGYVFCTPEQEIKLKSYVEAKEIPNLLLSGSPGTGKTTVTKILINLLDIDESDVLEINASDENNVETIREKILGFITTVAMGKFKIVHLGECVEEHEHIKIIENGQIVDRMIGELPKNSAFELLSLNLLTGIIENDKGVVTINREADVYEVELEDGRKIKVTDNHPFILSNFSECSINDGLTIGQEILTIPV